MNKFIEGFYVWVPSNTPSASGVPNKPQQFTVALQHTEQLQGNWEVALTEIHYPNNWFNVEEDVHFKVYVTDGATEMDAMIKEEEEAITSGSRKNIKTIYTEFFRVFAGYYPTVEAIVDDINNKSDLLEVPKQLDQTQICITRRSGSTNAGKPSFIVINKAGLKLLAFLGIETNKLVHQLPIYRTKPPTVTLHFPALYIYCDFIDVQYVGNERASILRVVPISGKGGEYVHKEFINRYYLPLSKGYINSVSFEIRDDTGKFVNFQSGKVILMLHFRPKIS